MNRAVVIGSGPAGLAAAILLGQRGWSVTVIEQHYRPGGCLHRFFRKGVGFDTGFHYVGSARRGQSFGQVLRHLGVDIPRRPLDSDGFDVLRFPGLEFRVPEGLDRWAARLVDTFPHETAGISRYVERHRACVAAYGLYRMDPLTLPDAILPWEALSLGTVLQECFSDPRIAAVIAGHGAPLYGVAPHEAPFGLHSVVLDHFLGGAWTFEGGGDRLAQSMVARVESLGGTVRLRTAAAEIRVAGGAAVGVVTASGELLPAELVIAAIHPKVVLSMLPEGSVRPAYRERVESARTGRAHLGVYLQVRGDLSPLAGRNLYRYHSWDVGGLDVSGSVDAAGEIPFWFLTAPGARGEGEGVVLGLAPAGSSLAAEASEPPVGRRAGGAPQRNEAYIAEKARLLLAFCGRVRAEFPDWEILRAEASTPLTMQHYTRVPGGGTYGHHHAVDQMGRYRLPMLTRVHQLVQVGQAVAMPGICGAMMSAYLAIGNMTGMASMIEELRAA